jgi:hypothetical protein
VIPLVIVGEVADIAEEAFRPGFNRDGDSAEILPRFMRTSRHIQHINTSFPNRD